MNHYLVLFDMGIYRNTVETALKEFFAGGHEGAILHLLEETNRRIAASERLRNRLLSQNIEPGQSIIRLLTGQNPSGLSFDDDLSAIGTRESRQAIEQYVAGPVVYELLRALCVPDPPGINPEQSVGEGAFLSHLVEHSEWTKNALTHGNFGGEPLPFPLGMQSEAMGRAERERLLAELKTLPPPDPKAGNERRVADLKNKLPKFGTAYLITKVIESQAGRVLPPGAGESVAEQIANSIRLLEASLAQPDLTVLLTLQS